MIHRFVILLPALVLFALNGCATVGNGPPDQPDAPPARLFAAMAMTGDQQASSVPTDSGVLIRDPDAAHWEKLGPTITITSSASVDPDDPETIYLACGNGIVRSRDGGESWRLLTGWRESDVLRLVVDRSDSSHLYAATIWGVIVSHDEGETWTAANEGLREFHAKDIVLDQQNPERLLLATTMGLFESVNRAESWQAVEGFPEVAVLRLERSRIQPELWIAGTEGQGLWISRDDARTWSPVAPALASSNVYAVALDPSNPARMAAGGWGTGVWLSSDTGTTWKEVGGNLPSPNLTAMLFDFHTAGRLWVSTFEKGMFFTDDSGAEWSDPELVGAYIFDLGYL